MSTQTIRRLHDRHVMRTYGRYPIALVRGEGARVWDADGREYLDFLGGIAVNVLGHCHPRVVEAIERQARTLLHCSNLYYTEPGGRLAEVLVAQGGLDRIFFCNSGAEANEGAIKLARKFQFRRGNPERTGIVSLRHAFHGRTAFALAATPKPAAQEGFGPLPLGFSHVEPGDIEALSRAVDGRVAAVLLEPVQGEGGIRPLDSSYLRRVRELTEERGVLLLFDEVQCGMGRLGGHLFAYPSVGVKPDVITMAKGLGGGLPVGALCATADVADLGFQPGDHATTFGANPVVCAAALATVRTIVDEGLLDRVTEMGQLLSDGLAALARRHPGSVVEVRGRGLMLGIELRVDAAAVLDGCHARGLLVNTAGGDVLRLLPPFVIDRDQAARALRIIEEALGEVESALEKADQA